MSLRRLCPFLLLAFAACPALPGVQAQAQTAAQPASHPASQPAAPEPATPPGTETETTWKRASDAHAAELTRRFGAGTDPALRTELLSLAARDRQARGLEPGPDGHRLATPNLRAADAALSAELRTLVEAHGWPTVALVGLPASNAAMVVLTHAPDHDWQRALLPVLEELADAGKIDSAPLAVVIDKELVSQGKLQRYGTQFQASHGTMQMYAVEDPAGLDKRRERVLLPPLEVYRTMLSRMYGLPAGNRVVSPSPAPVS